MALLKEKRVMWVKLGQPEETWDKSATQWSLIILVDSDFQKKWISKGMGGAGRADSPRTIEVDGKKVPAIKLQKKTKTKDGDDLPSVPVLDIYGQDVDPRIVGNGSVMNIQYKTVPYDFNGKKGLSVRLIRTQVVELVEYKGGSGDSNEFEFMARDESPFKDEELDLDDDVFE